MAERAGYTVTMFLVDTAPSMGKVRADGGTHLEWALRFVKLKIQEMIYNGRKTDQCGVIVFGSDETNNIVAAANGGYEHVSEHIPIGTPSGATLAALDALRPSDSLGDPVDALIVALETQQRHLANKPTWARRLVLLTDAEGPVELEDWEAVVAKFAEYRVDLTVVGVDFDDEEAGFKEEVKSRHKEENERFFAQLIEATNEAGRRGVLGSLAFALDELARPEPKITKSTMLGVQLRLGSPAHGTQALEIPVKFSKATSRAAPKSWKRFAPRTDADESQRAGASTSTSQSQTAGGKVAVKVEEADGDTESEPESDAEDAQPKPRVKREASVKREEGVKKEDGDGGEGEEEEVVWAELRPRTEYFSWKEDVLQARATAAGEKEPPAPSKRTYDPAAAHTQEREELVRGFRYGASHVPCADGAFAKLESQKGLDICAFFEQKNFRREYAMGEVSYVWGDPASPSAQLALSALVRAMDACAEDPTKPSSEEEDGKRRGKLRFCAVARYVSADGRDPKMGVLWPVRFDAVDCLLWVQMPFADDVRRYAFAPLTSVRGRDGKPKDAHPFLPTAAQQDAMDAFVDAMELGDAGERNEDGGREPWFDPALSYSPSVHRTKQALFHAAVVADLAATPPPPPHPELTKYFAPPKPARKRARGALAACIDAFGVAAAEKKSAKRRKGAHVHAADEDEGVEGGAKLLLEGAPEAPSRRAKAGEAPARREEKEKGREEDYEMVEVSVREDTDDEGAGWKY